MPRAAIIRGVFALIPRSSAATVNAARPTAGTTYGSAVETSAERFAPAISPDAAHPREQGLRVGLGRGDADPHRAALAQVAGQRAGVDAGDADHALLAQRRVERTPRPPARRHPGRVADDVAGDPDPGGLGVLVVEAGVADVGGGHHHDLAVVRRVGERLLVARHPGGEHRLTEGLALGAVGLPTEGPAVFENEQSGRRHESRRTSFSASRDGSLKDVERGRP